MSGPSGERCSACYFFVATPGIRGRCYFFPPQKSTAIVPTRTSSEGISFPEMQCETDAGFVIDDDWCGHFKVKP